jgi:hypothetical protein
MSLDAARTSARATKGNEDGVGARVLLVGAEGLHDVDAGGAQGGQ